MNTVRTVVIGRLLCAAILSIAAGVLAFYGRDGWGWFLFIAIWLGAITASSKSDGSSKVID